MDDTQKADEITFPVEDMDTVIAKWTTDSPLQLGKKRKDEDVPEENFIQVVSKFRYTENKG